MLRGTETTVKPMVGNRTQGSKPTVLWEFVHVKRL